VCFARAHGVVARGPIELTHQLPVHGPRGLQVLGEIMRLVLEPCDPSSERGIRGLELSGALLYLIDQRACHPTTGDVGQLCRG